MLHVFTAGSLHFYIVGDAAITTMPTVRVRMWTFANVVMSETCDAQCCTPTTQGHPLHKYFGRVSIKIA